MRYFDTHAHLNLKPLDDAAEQTLRQCSEKNIMVNVVGVDGPSSIRALQLALQFENAVCSAAIHPKEVDSLGGLVEEHFRTIERLLEDDQSGNIVSVGETGLDASGEADLTLQTSCFLRHARLAERFNKPLNIHCRDAHCEMLRLLQDVKAVAIMHCFTAGPAEAKAYVKLGCFLSIPGIVTFKNARDLQEAVRQTPWENLLVETDAPYLSPVPVRGQVNTPLNVVYVVEKIAELKQTPLEEAAAILFANALRAFQIRGST